MIPDTLFNNKNNFLIILIVIYKVLLDVTKIFIRLDIYI